MFNHCKSESCEHYEEQFQIKILKVQIELYLTSNSSELPKTTDGNLYTSIWHLKHFGTLATRNLVKPAVIMTNNVSQVPFLIFPSNPGAQLVAVRS